MFSLTLRSADGQQQELNFREDDIRIGRDEANDMPLEDSAVSHVHAAIYRLGENYYIRDLESLNGTIVNDERVRERVLENDDHILLGNTVLIFRYRRRASDTSIQRLIQQELGELLAPVPARTGTSTTNVQPRAQYDGTVELEKPDVKTDLVQMAHWCSQGQLLERALDVLEQAAASSAISIIFRDAGGNVNRAAWRATSSGEPLFDLPVARLLKNELSALIPWVQADQRLAALEDLQHSPIHSIAYSSFVCGRSGFGVLYLERAGEHPAFQPEDLTVILRLGARLATALEVLWRVEGEKALKNDGRATIIETMLEMRHLTDVVDSCQPLMEQALDGNDVIAAKTAWEMIRLNQEQMQELVQRVDRLLND